MDNYVFVNCFHCDEKISYIINPEQKGSDRAEKEILAAIQCALDSEDEPACGFAAVHSDFILGLMELVEPLPFTGTITNIIDLYFESP